MGITKGMKNKTIFIFGGSSGIGLAIARQVASKGGSLIVTGRNPDKLSAVVTSLRATGATVQGHQADTEDRSGLEALITNLGPVDHFVSMAGGFTPGGFLSAAEDDIRHGVEEKLFANMVLARLVSPHLQTGGSMTFTAGADGNPQAAAGPFTGNAAIRVLVQGLAADLAPRIRVNAVAPIWTRTALWRDLPDQVVDEMEQALARKIPLQRTARPEEIADAYLFLMQNGFITGQTLCIDGGLSLPK